MTDDTTTDTSTNQATDDQQQQAADADKSKQKAKSFTQADVDVMINKAKAAARKEFGDYNDLKLKAEEFDKLQESTKSAEDKLRAAHDKAVRERDDALTRARNTMVRSAVISTSSRLGCVDPEAVAALLPQGELVIEGDEVLGVEEAVKALLAKKPYLRSKSAAGAGSEMNGGEGVQTVFNRSQIKKWARGEAGGLTPERQKAINEAAAAGRIINDR